MTDNPQGQAVPDVGAASPRLADVLDKHTPSGAEGMVNCWCEQWFDTFREHAEHQAAVWREVCMIRTVEQLDALPEGSVIRSGRSVLERGSSRGRGLGPVESRWYGIGWELSVDADDIELPALLVWHPDWSEQ